MTIIHTTLASYTQLCISFTKKCAFDFFKYIWAPIGDYALGQLLNDHNWIDNPQAYSSKVKLLAIHFFGLHKSGTFSFQDVLPKLPVPPLNQTLTQFKESVRPLLTPEEFKETTRKADAFALNKGPKLQQLLVERAQATDCWVKDWWFHFAYLVNRESLITSTTWGGGDAVAGIPDQYTKDNICAERMARLCRNILVLRDQILNESYPALKMKKSVPVCMEPYKLIFGTSRIPGIDYDTLVTSSSNHIAVTINDLIYKMNVYDDEGKLLRETEFKKQFEWILKDSSETGPGAAVSMLTGQKRDTWAKDRERLKKLNLENLELVETALLVARFNPSSPQNLQEMTEAALKTPHDLWFDKTVNFTMYENGGFNGTIEHTPMDADTLALFLDKTYKSESYRKDELPLKDPRTLTPPKRLEWTLDDELKARIAEVKETLPKQVADLDLKVAKFDWFTSEEIKALRMSPDSFMQMIIQNAYFKMYEKPTLTYETAGTRIFKGARTETIRSVSTESREMCAALNNEGLPRETKRALVRRAVNKHAKTRYLASLGQGCDRHLMGLRILDQSQDPLFSDKAFTLPFKLGTSQTPCELSTGGGFYPICEDGYGISYFLRKEYTLVYISSLHHCKETNSGQFLKCLEKSIKEFQELFNS